MVANPGFQTLRRVATTVAIAIMGTGLIGCAAVNQHLSALYTGALIRAENKHDLADVREETREALAQQRQEALRMAAQHEVEQARINAENQRLEMQFCQANQEALQRVVKSNIRDQVETKMNFNVVQGLEAGELEVDVPELQALMKKREEADKQEQEALKQNPPPKQPCSCCDQPCGCEPGLKRRHCPRCRHRECEAEEKCGGPEALRKIAQEPLKRPLRPAEIPLKLPVRLTFGMHGPEMEAAKIRRIPNVQEPLTRPCDRCGMHGPGCDCNLRCPTGTCPAPANQGQLAPTTSPLNVDFLDPPKPTRDDSARRTPARPTENFPNVPTRFTPNEAGAAPPPVIVEPTRIQLPPRP